MIELANIFIDYVNYKILGDHMDQCSRLELDKVNSVYLSSSHIKMTDREVFKTKSKAKLLTPPPIKKNYKKYLFQVKTKPNQAVYEFNIIIEETAQNSNKKKLINLAKIDRSQLSRINKYGNDAHCIHYKFPDLRKYCYCKDKLLNLKTE